MVIVACKQIICLNLKFHLFFLIGFPFFLLIYFYFAGLHHQGIFRVSGSQVEINNFKDAFERGEDPLADMTDASDINSVAGVLKLYLRELREPLFPIIYFEQFMELARKFNYLNNINKKKCKRL